VVITDSGSRSCDVSNDVMKSSILNIPNDDISGMEIPFYFYGRVFGDGAESKLAFWRNVPVW